MLQVLQQPNCFPRCNRIPFAFIAILSIWNCSHTSNQTDRNGRI